MMKIKEFIQSVSKKWTETYTKRAITFILFNSVLWLWATYILAFLGRVEIAEDLSGKVVVTILGTVITYCLKSFFENVSEKGWKGKMESNDDSNIRRDL